MIISGFVALTLSPMLCSRVLRAHAHGAGGVIHWAKRYEILTWLLYLGRPDRAYRRLAAPAGREAGEAAWVGWRGPGPGATDVVRG
mgnify:CR=1 FL=1